MSGDTPPRRRTPLRWLAGLATLLVFLLLGELVVRSFHVSLPGSIAGMMMLLGAFATPLGPTLEGLVADTAQTLLAVMPLLLIPLGVGIITQLDLLATDGPFALIALVCGWIAATVVCALIALGVLRRSGGR